MGPGWWPASDGKWYPPTTAPASQPSSPAPAYPPGAPPAGPTTLPGPSTAPGPEVRIEFELTNAEIRNALVTMQMHKRRNYGSVAASLCLASLAASDLLAGGKTTGSLVSLEGVAAGVVVTAVAAIVFALRYLSTSQRNLSGSKIYRFAPSGVGYQSVKATWSRPWTMFSRSTETALTYILFWRNSPGDRKSFIPKSAFQTPGDEALFRQLLTEHIEAELRPR
jgi:hypothetical protein